MRSSSFPRSLGFQAVQSLVTARLGPKLGAVWSSARFRALVLGHRGVLTLYAAVVGLVLLPLFSAGSPPGVDAPTFLHLGWATEQALTGNLGGIVSDRFWYGGFPYLQAYSPLGYGLIGLVAAATPFPLELVYRAALFVAYLALGASVYWLALEFGLRRSIAVWAGLLTLGSYPVFTGLGIFGWFSTMVALPLGLFGDGLLERANRTQKGRLAVWGGVLFAGCLLAHHMTAIGLALGLVPWLLYQYWTGAGDRRRLTRNVVLFSAGGVAVGGLWGVFFLVHILSVGFERELAGNWRFSLEGYRSRLLDRELIGVEIYPSYLGWVQVPLAAGGVL